MPVDSITPVLPVAPPAAPSVPEWNQWRDNPTPENLSSVLKVVQPTLDSAARRYPHINPAILGGEAKRLAVQAIKSYEPGAGASLTTHVFNHLRPLSRYSQTVTKAINVPRGAREGYAAYLGAKRDFMEENNREPHDAELMDILGVNRQKLTRLHQLGTYEFPEGQLENSPDVTNQDDRRLDLWADYVYHDLPDRDKMIMDLKMGRNGQQTLDSTAIAAKMGLHPSYINRRAQEIGQRILDGVDSHS